MITVRVVTGGQKNTRCKDTEYPTRRKALNAIRDLGTLTTISRIGRLYIATPKK